MSLEIPIRAELNGLQGDLSKAVSVVSDASEKFAQAADKASKRAAGGVDAILASGNSLKQQYRALSREAVDLADKYGAMDARAIKAAQAAGEIKDKIEDTNVVINAFKADSKFTVVAGALQQAAGAASIVTGAMGLLGTQSEKTQQVMLKVQSALALTQGLASIKEMGASFTALSAVIQTSVIPSLLTMKGLLITTGIGALVAVVATLAYNWYETSKAQDEAKKSLEDYSKALKDMARENQDIGVRMMTGRAKQEAELSNKITNEILDRQDRIKEIQDKAKSEERELTRAELYQVQQLKEQQVRINEAGQIEMQELRQKFRDEDTKKAEQDAAKKLAIQKKLNKEIEHYIVELDKQITKKTAKLSNIEIDKRATQRLTDLASSTLKPIPITAFLVMPKNLQASAEFSALREEFQSFGQELTNMLSAFGGQAAYALGQSMVTGEDLGESIKQQLASLMQQVAAAFIAMGIAYKTTGIGFGYGALLVGSGIALMVAAGALSASAGGGGRSGGSTPAMSPTASGGDGFGGGGIGSNANFNNFNMRTEGKDLILAVQRQGNYNRRG